MKGQSTLEAQIKPREIVINGAWITSPRSLTKHHHYSHV